MLVMVGLFIASMIPCIAIFIWLRNQKGMQEGYKEACDKAVINGALCAIPVMLVSLTLDIIGRVLGLRDLDPLIYEVYHKFIVLALSEELCKFYMMRRIVKKADYSWLSITVIMTLVGVGFEMLEAIPYAIGSGPGPMFMRGLTMMHPSFGFIMGYFYAKSLYDGKKGYAVIGILIPWILHGTYDYCLSEPMMAMEWPGYLALGLAAFSVVLMVLFIRFVIKARKNEECIRPIGALKAEPDADAGSIQ